MLLRNTYNNIIHKNVVLQLTVLVIELLRNGLSDFHQIFCVYFEGLRIRFRLI